MSTAARYNLAWNYIWEETAGWKRAAIIEDMSKDKKGRFFQEFTNEIINLAEGTDEIPAVKSNYIIEDNNIVISGSLND